VSEVRSTEVGTAANAFDALLARHGLGELRAARTTTLQVNVGRLCNQACRHCHVDAGPHRTAAADNMGAEVARHVVRLLGSRRFELLDITGGAPELNPHFRDLVVRARALGVRVMDRCNLSVLFEPGQEELADFLAAHEVEVTASLPFYHRGPTDRQRGAGVFDKSIDGLRLLNQKGYGDGHSGLRLNLVYNPAGAYLPADQHQLEADFRRELDRLFGIRFDALFCITNMPIRRFLDWLVKSGRYEGYMETLVNAFNPAAVDGVMCRTLVSVGPDGTLHDCDFNQMLELPLADSVAVRNVRDLSPEDLDGRAIRTGEHCLGCTAGAGSSCGGQTA
jgi:radical SAM/Cys-rich protein